MRVLAAGSVPLPAEGHRAALLDEVVRLRRAGHDVEVLSVDRLAAAHRYTAAAGLPAAIEIGLTGRRFDAVVVQIEPGLPVRARASRVERAIALTALASLLRRHPDVILRLDVPDDLPGGPGGRAGLGLWSIARRIEVGTQVVADALAELLPDGRERVSVVGPGSPLAIGAPDDVWSDGRAGSAAEVDDVIRRRAAVTRQALGRSRRSPPQCARPDVRVGQWEWLPAPGLGVPDLGRPGDATSRRSATGRSARALATGGLAAAERHVPTRWLARLARWGLAQVRVLKLPH